MAVSGKTSDFELPYFVGLDEPPDVAAATKALADRVNTILKGIKGDATLAPNGTLTIADAAVSSRKMKPTRGRVEASSELGVLGVTAYTDVPGTEKKLTLPTKSLVVVRAVFGFQANDNHANYGSGDFFGAVFIDGVGTTGQVAYFRCDMAGESQVFAAQGYVIDHRELAAGEHTIKLRAHSAAGTEWDGAVVLPFATHYEYEVWAA